MPTSVDHTHEVFICILGKVISKNLCHYCRFFHQSATIFGSHLGFWPFSLCQPPIFMFECTSKPPEPRVCHWNQVSVLLFSEIISKHQFRYWQYIGRSTAILAAILTFDNFYSASHLYSCSSVLPDSQNPGFATKIRSLCSFLAKLCKNQFRYWQCIGRSTAILAAILNCSLFYWASYYYLCCFVLPTS